jgi:hypothetical protein
MRSLWIVVLVALFVSPSAAEPAKKYAPGQKQTEPGEAKKFAPGQKQKTPGGAKKFAPGQKTKNN